jgi:hypothetical protein
MTDAEYGDLGVAEDPKPTSVQLTQEVLWIR